MRLRKLAMAWLIAALPAAGQTTATLLEQSFRAMYNLHFDEARRLAGEHRRLHPGDAMADVTDASALIFSEFDRLKILQSEFFTSDKNFEGRSERKADPEIKARFDAALERAEQKAQSALKQDSQDKNALFAMALIHGLRADHAALIEKRDLAALGFTKTATTYAERLLKIQPDFYDAYLPTGLGKFLVGQRSAPVRWMLRLGGVKGNVQEGMGELKITAEKGHYLQPFARLLLAVGYLREDKRDEARRLLMGLRDEFPANPLFAQEVAKLEVTVHAATGRNK